jgi:hypothetical protein
MFFLCSDISTFIISRDNNLPPKEEIKLHESFQIKSDLTKSDKKKVFFFEISATTQIHTEVWHQVQNPYQQIQCHKIIMQNREIQNLLFPWKMEESILKKKLLLVN